jgi:hypothetical protein
MITPIIQARVEAAQYIFPFPTYKNLNHAILARPSCRAVRIEGYGTDPFITSRYLVPSNLARKLHPSIK